MSKPHKNSTVPPERTIVVNIRGGGTTVFKIPGQVQQQIDALTQGFHDEEERNRQAAEFGRSPPAR